MLGRSETMQALNAFAIVSSKIILFAGSEVGLGFEGKNKADDAWQVLRNPSAWSTPYRSWLSVKFSSRFDRSGLLHACLKFFGFSQGNFLLRTSPFFFSTLVFLFPLEFRHTNTIPKYEENMWRMSW